MRGLDELARYSVIAGYLHHLRPGGSVLDVGSGEGLLADHLRPFGCSRYLGVDLSEAAIRQAAGRADAKTAFAAADAESYSSARALGRHRLQRVRLLLQRSRGDGPPLRAFLEEGGVFIVSTFRSRRADVIVRRLLETCRLLEETAITNRKGTWVVRVLECAVSVRSAGPAPASAGPRPAAPRSGAPGSASGG